MWPGLPAATKLSGSADPARDRGEAAGGSPTRTHVVHARRAAETSAARDRRLARRRPARPAPVRRWPTTARSCSRAAAGCATSTVAYETWGELDADGGNAILVCHALTGDSHAAGPSGHGHPTPGWWDDLVGPGKALDTDRYFVVCANVLGGCQGTTGPGVADPATGRPLRLPLPGGHRSATWCGPRRCVADALGVGRWLTVVGGSMGGMQVLEWGVMFPDRVAQR